MAQSMPWQTALAVFIGTLPIFGAILWNLLKVDRIETRLDRIDGRLVDIHKDLSKLTERVATLEERDRWTHPVTRP